jgi:hypothetical protein
LLTCEKHKKPPIQRPIIHRFYFIDNITAVLLSRRILGSNDKKGPIPNLPA